VPAMKLTFTAAMRARDVSRPREEDIAAAEAAEAGAAGGSRARTASGGAAARGTEAGSRRPDAAKPIPGRGRPEAGAIPARGREAGASPAGGTEAGASPAGGPGAAAADGARTRRPGFPRRRRGGRDGTRRGRGDR
jgi:hypothetical protein